MFGSKKGVSLLYVLMALVCVGAMGSLVLSMAKKEAGDSSLRTSSELARFSATAGLTYATADFFTNSANAAKVIDILNNWDYTDNSKNDGIRWVVRGEGGKEFKEIDIDDDGKYDMKFRVKIVNIDARELKPVTHIEEADKSFFVVMLESESIDKSGSRAKNTGFYKITGFQKTGTHSDIPTHALYMGGGNMQIWCPITVNGATYIGNKTNQTQAVYHTAATNAVSNVSEYNGEFQLYQNSDNLTDANTPFFACEEFKGPAYFEGGTVSFQRPKISFAKGFGGSAEFQLYDQGNVNVAANSKVIMSNKLTNANNSLKIIFEENCKLIYNKNKQTPSNYPENFWSSIEDKDIITTMTEITDEYIWKNLGITIPNPPACVINTSDIPDASKIPVGYPSTSHGYGNDYITGDTLTKWYNDVNKQKYKNEWLVLTTPNNNAVNFPFSSGGSGFEGKAIIFYKLASGSSGLPNVSKNGVILFYIPPDVTTNHNMVISGNKGDFRGMFYNASSGNNFVNLASDVNWTVNGAFYNVGSNKESNSSTIRLGNTVAGRITVNYDKDALQELADLGVLTMTGGDPDPNSQRIQKVDLPNYKGGKSVLLSRSF